MLRSNSSDSTVASSPSSTRKRLFARVCNPLSSNSKPGPLLDTNPPPVARPSLDDTKKSFGAIKTTIKAAGTPLKLLRRLSNPTGQKPHVPHDDTPALSKIKVKRGRGRSYPFQVVRPPSMSRSHSAPGPAASNLSQSSISQTLPMSDSASRKSVAESNSTCTLFQDVHVPIDLQTGVVVTKVSAKESKKVTVRIDADLGQIFYQSRRARISESLTPFHVLRVMDRPAISFRL
jgi:hypothetical protein